jgi:hypothetical protein
LTENIAAAKDVFGDGLKALIFQLYKTLWDSCCAAGFTVSFQQHLGLMYANRDIVYQSGDLQPAEAAGNEWQNWRHLSQIEPRFSRKVFSGE